MSDDLGGIVGRLRTDPPASRPLSALAQRWAPLRQRVLLIPIARLLQCRDNGLIGITIELPVEFRFGVGDELSIRK
jgi:hypothetical protein